jgi:hypothetical protein
MHDWKALATRNWVGDSATRMERIRGNYRIGSFPGAERFIEFHRQHSTRISLIVVAPMLVELATAVLLVTLFPEGVPRALAALGLGLLALVWVSTFAVQVPLHSRLAHGFDSKAHRRLVNSNWLRTAAWSLRAAIAIAIAIAC